MNSQCINNQKLIMNNDLPPSWKFEEVVTINCEFSLFSLIIINVVYYYSCADLEGGGGVERGEVPHLPPSSPT